MDAPLVSIVTPSFNQGRFLGRTLESVRRQTYPRIEHHVFDGGSTDHSVAILRSCGERLHWVSRRDRGQADAINQGLRQARGEVLCYLNSDDVLEPHAVETAVRYFRTHAEWDLLYGRAFHLDEEDRRLCGYPTEPFSIQRLAERCILCQPATFWRRRVVERFGGFDERRTCALDYSYWLKLAVGGAKLVHIPETLAGSRLHPETKTASLRECCLTEAIEVCLEHLGHAAEGHFHALWQARAAAKGSWRWLALHPSLARRAAWWHYRWRNEMRQSPRTLAAALARRVWQKVAAARGKSALASA